jgi:hypothetical protein
MCFCAEQHEKYLYLDKMNEFDCEFDGDRVMRRYKIDISPSCGVGAEALGAANSEWLWHGDSA